LYEILVGVYAPVPIVKPSPMKSAHLISNDENLCFTLFKLITTYYKHLQFLVISEIEHRMENNVKFSIDMMNHAGKVLILNLPT